MFPIHPLWRTTALLCVAFALCILIFGLGAATVDPTDPAFRNAVMLAAGVTIGAIAATGVGAVVAAQARPRAHARAEPKPPADFTTCGEPGCSMPDGPEDSPLVQALAADPELMRQFNDGWPRGRLQDAQWSERELNEARGEALAQMASTASTPTERTLLVDALGSTMSAMKDARLPSDEELRRELTAYRYSGAVTTTGVRIPVTTREGAEAALRAQRQQRAAYWHERATAMLEEGNVQGAMADIVRSAADSLDPKLVKGVATRLVEDVDAFVHPLLLPSSGREAGIAELAVLSDTRLFAGQATRQLARMVEELCDRNAELAGRVVAGIGHSAAAMARANEEAIDPDNPRRELEDVTDGELMQEAIERGLVRMGAEVEPTSGLH